MSTAPPPTTTVADTPGFYLITIAPAEALCGEDYVYGTLCEEACATSVQRPRRLDGIAVRAWPFTPRTAFPNSGAVTMTPLAVCTPAIGFVTEWQVEHFSLGFVFVVAWLLPAEMRNPYLLSCVGAFAREYVKETGTFPSAWHCRHIPTDVAVPGVNGAGTSGTD